MWQVWGYKVATDFSLVQFSRKRFLKSTWENNWARSGPVGLIRFYLSFMSLS